MVPPPKDERPAGLDRAIREYRPPGIGPEAGELPVLDAWYASYPDPGIERVFELGANEIVFGQDTRQRVSNTRIEPFKWVAMLDIDASNGSRWRGTGWLASPSLVVTAGHCVYMHKQGGWVSTIRIRLGIAADDTGEITAEAAPIITARSSFRSVIGWIRNENAQADYGAIFLSKPMPREYGHFLYEARSDSALSKQFFNVDGYPADKPIYQQWFGGRDSAGVTARSLRYTIDTYSAQSGAPVWDDDGRRVVLGIHTRGTLVSNEAVRITEDVARNVTRWSNGEK